MKQYLSLFIVIITIGTLTQVSSDMYAPALPMIAHDLSAQLAWVQTSMAVFLLGVALSLLFYGPLSEGYGRRLPLLIGLSISVLGGLLCFWAPNITILIIARFIQGLGSGAGAGLWRSIFRDVFSGDKLAEYGSYLSIFIMFVLPAAPLLGGYFAHYFGWRTIFIFLSLDSALGLFLVKYVYRETSQHHHRDRLRFRFIKKTYIELLSHRAFLGASLSSFCIYGAYFSWFVVSPALLIKQLGMTPVHYGYLNFAASLFSLAIGGFLAARLIKRFGGAKIITMSWLLMMLSGMGLLVSYAMFGLNSLAIIIPGVLFMFATPFFWTNVFATAMSPVGHIAGYAGCMYSCLQLAGGAVIGSVASHLPHGSPLVLGVVYILLPLLSMMFYYFGVRSNS